MNIVVINNGLGNQMSQYAFYLSKKKYCKNVSVIFDPFSINEHNGSELDRIFGIRYPESWLNRIISNIYTYHRRPKIWRLLNMLGVRVIKEPTNYDYSIKFLTFNKLGLNFYTGGWHSEKYFSSIKDDIISTFQFKSTNDADTRFTGIVRDINNCPESVSLHVRRGDYLLIPQDNPYQLGGVTTIDYYKRAIEKIRDLSNNIKIYCFSDDLAWCKEQFGEDSICYVDCNKGKDSWRDMYLMTLCKYHINANSTFSWWGAWLCQKEGRIIICPKYFIRGVVTKDIYPETWIKI